MSKFYSKLILLLLTGFLSVNKSYCQSCLVCLGGSFDGNAKDIISSCSAPATIFAGGIYTGYSGSSSGTCSGSTTVFAAGGSYGGSASAVVSVCAVPASIVAGGDYSGSSNATISPCASPVTVLAGGAYDGSSSTAISPCNSPSTILTGGQYDGFSDAAISPCAPPVTLLTGGSYDGSSGSIVSVCAPPASLVLGGSYTGMADAFAYCEPLAVQNAGTIESFTINLYPNPASDEFSISFDAALPKAGTIIINDVLGKEITSENIYPSQQQYSFTAEDWAEGAYMIRIVYDGKQFNKQLMVIKNNN